MFSAYRKTAQHFSVVAWALLLMFQAPGLGAQDEATQAPPSSAEEVASSKAVPAKNIDLKEVVEDPSTLVVPDTPITVEPSSDPLSRDGVEAETAPSEIADDSALPAAVNVEEQTPKDTPVKNLSEPKQAALVLLNAEVSPGTTTRLAWSPNVSFLGISAPTSVLVVNGVNPGPTLCLTAAVHGDEINGIETVRRVLYSLDAKKLSGAVIGVPIVNLQGFRAGSRYMADRRDLNRFFPGNPLGSAASRTAYSFFQEVISHCDMLIDLHTGSFRRTNLPQLRADLNYPSVQNLSEEMGKIVVVQSTGAKGSLRRAATESGIPTVTLEAGAPNELDRDAVEDSVNSVEAALNGLGLLKSRRVRRRSDEPVYYRSVWVRTSEGGILISDIKLGDKVKQGELLGVVTNPITNERSEIRTPHNGRVIGMALNQVMHPGFAAYHVGINRAKDPVDFMNDEVSGEDAGVDELEDYEDPDNDESAPRADTLTELPDDAAAIDEEDESGR